MSKILSPVILAALGGAGAFFVLVSCGGTQQGQALCLESFSSEVAGAQVGLSDSTTELAESFVYPLPSTAPSASPTPFSLTTVQLSLSSSLPPSPSPLPSVPNPSPFLALNIESDLSGSPSGVGLGGDATLDMTQVRGSTSAFYRFTFPSALTLNSGTVYWLRLKGAGLSPAFTVYWSGSNQQGAFPGGSAKVYSGGSWSSALLGPYRALLFMLGC